MKLKRTMTTFLAVAMTVETLAAPLSVLASSDVVPQSSGIAETGSEVSAFSEMVETGSEVSAVSEVVETGSEVSAFSEIESQILESEPGSISSGIISEIPQGSIDAVLGEMDSEEEPEAEGPVLLDEKMLLASIDEEKQEITVSFSAFADADSYVYEVLDKDGNILKSGALDVVEKEVKGDLEEVFSDDRNYTAGILLDETWPSELTLHVYDNGRTSYITCSLLQEKAVESVAAETNEEDKISVIWTDTKDCDGYVVELLQEDGQLVDSVTVEDAAACMFKTTEADLSVQVTPYVQVEDSAPVYYIGAANAVMLLSVENASVSELSEVPSAQSEPVYPGIINGLTAVAGDHEVRLTWADATDTQAYNVYCMDPSNGALQLLTTVTTPNCTIQNLRGNVTYWFAVEAVRDENGQTIKGALSSPVSAAPYIAIPNAPVGLSGSNSNGATYLTWGAGGIADGYIVYSYNYSQNTYVEIGRTSDTSFTDSSAGNVDKHKYMVKAYRTDDNVNFYISTTGPEVLVYGNATVSAANSVHPIYYSAKITRKTGLYTKFRKDNTKQGNIKPGQKVTIIYRRWKQSLVSYKGKQYYVYNGAMRVTGQSYTKKDYSKQTKEYFINSNGYKSSSKYLIWISTYTQRINVFQGSKGNWTLIKSEQCVTGKISTYTPLGAHKLHKKKKAHYYGRSFYKYLSYFSGENKMHTRPARRSTGRYIDKRMGIPLSNGCVRLSDSLAKWVYNSVPKNSTVLVY